MKLIPIIAIHSFILLILSVSTGYPKEPNLYEDKDVKKAAAALLHRAPTLKPLPENALSEDEFISMSRIVAYSYSKKRIPLNSIIDAVAFLESILLSDIERGSQVGWTKANITSEPNGWTVKYRGYVDHKKNKGVWEDIKTNNVILVEPRLYIFQCAKDNGEACGEKVISCATNCKVAFP